MTSEAVLNQQIKAYKMDIVHQLYVGTADQNYITARWCFTNGFYTDFFWLGVHTFEKYLKAILLLNNSTTKKLSHNIVKLYEKVTPICSDLLPQILKAPEALQSGRDISPERFFEISVPKREPDNRYMLYGYVVHEQDIFMLDQMVFAIRRLTIRLDDRAFPGHGNCAMTHRQHLTREPNYFPNLGMPLDSVIADSENSPARMAALALNLTPFAPADFPDSSASIPRLAFRNSMLHLRILDRLQDPHSVAIALPVARWCLDRITLPDDVKKQIEDAAAAVSKAS